MPRPVAGVDKLSGDKQRAHHPGQWSHPAKRRLGNLNLEWVVHGRMGWFLQAEKVRSLVTNPEVQGPRDARPLGDPVDHVEEKTKQAIVRLVVARHQDHVPRDKFEIGVRVEAQPLLDLADLMVRYIRQHRDLVRDVLRIELLHGLWRAQPLLGIVLKQPAPLHR